MSTLKSEQLFVRVETVMHDLQIYVCCHVKHFENALCTADRNPDRLYCIDPNLWRVYRMRIGLFSDFYSKSETGNAVYPCISAASAD